MKNLRNTNSHVQECIFIENTENLTITSTNEKRGVLNGQGAAWWGYINYLIYSENRPRLLHVTNSTNILVENINFINSPYWTTYFEDVSNLEIRHSKVDARRTNYDGHNFYNLGALNTDGFDVAGKNIWVHNVEVWNQDDCLCVKASSRNNYRASCSENILFENSTVSGIGLVIGSIGPSEDHSCVRNVTFRNIVMHETWKGIYIKSRPGHTGTGEITDIFYHNITMHNPSQWPIWIGPQQAIYRGACSLTWPYFGSCTVPSQISFNNIVLKDIDISLKHTISSWLFGIKPGVILSNSTNPMKNIIFDDVKINGDVNQYICENTIVQTDNKTYPIPCKKKNDITNSIE